MNKIIAAVAIGAISLGVVAAISRGAVAQDTAVRAPGPVTISNADQAQISVQAPVTSETSTAASAPVDTTASTASTSPAPAQDAASPAPSTVVQDAAVPAQVSATDSNTVPAQVSVPAPASSATSTAVPAPVTATTPTTPSDVSVTPVSGTVTPVVVPGSTVVETKPPTVAPPPPVVAPVPDPVTPGLTVVETEPGATCKTYYPKGLRFPYVSNLANQWTPTTIDDVLDAIGNEPAVDMGFDAKGTAFDAANIAKHAHVVASWDGVFEAKKAGEYVFTMSSIYPYSVTVNGQTVKGNGDLSLGVSLKKGPNKISIVRVVSTYQDVKRADRGGRRARRNANDPSAFSIDYRLSSSAKAAKPITPSMLKHVVAEEEEDW